MKLNLDNLPASYDESKRIENSYILVLDSEYDFIGWLTVNPVMGE